MKDRDKQIKDIEKELDDLTNKLYDLSVLVKILSLGHETERKHKNIFDRVYGYIAKILNRKGEEK